MEMITSYNHHRTLLNTNDRKKQPASEEVRRESVVCMKTRERPDPSGARELALLLGQAFPRFPKQLLMADALMRAHGLPLSQVQLLLLLAEDEISIGKISKYLGIAKPNVSPIVNSLQQSGLVERIRSKKDRRVVCVHLTEAGAEKVDELRQTLTQQAESWQQKLTAAQMKELMRSLNSLLTIMKKLE